MGAKLCWGGAKQTAFTPRPGIRAVCLSSRYSIPPYQERQQLLNDILVAERTICSSLSLYCYLALRQRHLLQIILAAKTF